LKCIFHPGKLAGMRCKPIESSAIHKPDPKTTGGNFEEEIAAIMGI
jgi:hypothetical protein